jgi:hypothetical protein
LQSRQEVADFQTIGQFREKNADTALAADCPDLALTDMDSDWFRRSIFLAKIAIF